MTQNGAETKRDCVNAECERAQVALSAFAGLGEIPH
jgi:hypothetical protein